jgi:membrane dipeptidase
MLEALAENGGVIGLNFAPGFLSQEYNEASQGRRQEQMKKWEALQKQYQDDPERLKEEREKLWAAAGAGMPPVPIGALADHIEHVVSVAGHDHVGLGSDFDGIRSAPQGLDDVTCLYRIVVELKQRGWSDLDLRKLLGLNTLRVIKANTGC